MLQTTVIALFMGVWASLYLLDAFLKTHQKLGQYYVRFLNTTGLIVSIANVRWYTTCFNRLFVRLGSWKPHFLKTWFTLGVWFGLVAMLLSAFLLTLMVVNTLGRKPVEQQVLTPVMPGVNLPMSQICYYLLTLLVCGILHEMGHAIAAVREQVRVNGFGMFVFILYPGAFVDLNTDQLQMISPLRRLRIYCAGVWHNFVIVIVAFLTIVLLPWLLVPFYSLGTGVVITNLAENSAVSGVRGLAVSDQVTSVGQCQVTSVQDWNQCIADSIAESSIGFCMPVDLVNQQDIAMHSYTTVSGTIECCANTSSTHLCFYYHSKGSYSMQHACLPARTTTDRQSCHLTSDCYNPSTPSVCVTPSLDNSTKLLRVYHRGKPPLLFLGPPLDLHYSVSLSNYIPNSHLLPLTLPYVLETFSKYLISLSGALALLNVVPCYALDGQFILEAFIELGLRSVIPSTETRTLIYTVLLFLGSVLVGTNIIIALYTLFIT